jgi:hypothetical protein
VAAQFGEDHGHLGVANVGGQLLFDVARDLFRAAAAREDVTDQRHGNAAVGPHRNADAELGIAPDRHLKLVINADPVQVGVLLR